MRSTRREYRRLYHWIKNEGVRILIERDHQNQHEPLDIIATLPHPAVASNRDIARACSRIQEAISDILDDKEITPDGIQQELRRIEELAIELEARASEAIDESPDPRLDRIENLLQELRDTASTTQQKVGDVSEYNREMMSMLSTTQERVDQTLKSVCPKCGGDLQVYPHRGSDDGTELRLGCRNCDHEEYHVTSSFRVQKEDVSTVLVEDIGPLNANWWIAEISAEARSLRSIIFRYDGQEIVSIVVIIVAALILSGLVSADVDLLWSLAGVGLSLLSLLIGPAVWDFIQRLRDPYENRYHEAALTVIDRVGGDNKRVLRQIALKHLDKVERSEAEEILDECALELARACRRNFSYSGDE